MERWQNKVAVVTGASSGIGVACVKDLINAGLIVVGLARRVERMEELKKSLPEGKQQNFHFHRCDVSDLSSVNEAFDWIIKKLGGVDILINNAGCARPGQLCTMDLQKAQEVIQTNLMGVVYCTQRAFKSMKERESAGHVIVINSILGKHVMGSRPNQVNETNMYSPSKFALTAAAEVYRQEFHGLGTKVKITNISPGLVDTEIVPDEFKVMLKDSILRPEDISSGIMYAISTPPYVQIHEMTIKPLGESI